MKRIIDTRSHIRHKLVFLFNFRVQLIATVLMFAYIRFFMPHENIDIFTNHYFIFFFLDFCLAYLILLPTFFSSFLTVLFFTVYRYSNDKILEKICPTFIKFKFKMLGTIINQKQNSKRPYTPSLFYLSNEEVLIISIPEKEIVKRFLLTECTFSLQERPTSWFYKFLKLKLVDCFINTENTSFKCWLDNPFKTIEKLKIIQQEFLITE